MTHKEEIAARYRKWIAALRSGEYKQGRGQLRDGDLFCCLGVLVDLGDHTKRTEDGWITSKGEVSKSEYFPENIGDELALTDDYTHHLVNLNDIDKLAFNEIANYIETKILPEFL